MNIMQPHVLQYKAGGIGKVWKIKLSWPRHFLTLHKVTPDKGSEKWKNNLCRDFEGICKLLICARPSSFAQSHCFICVVQLNSEVWPPQTLPWCHRFTMLFFLKCNQLVECGFMFFFFCVWHHWGFLLNCSVGILTFKLVFLTAWNYISTMHWLPCWARGNS